MPGTDWDSGMYGRVGVLNTTLAPDAYESNTSTPIGAVLLALTFVYTMVCSWCEHEAIRERERERLRDRPRNRGEQAVARRVAAERTAKRAARRTAQAAVVERERRVQVGRRRLRQVTAEESLALEQSALESEQQRLQQSVIRKTDFLTARSLPLVGGFDISYFKEHPRRAVACLAVTDLDGTLVKITTADVVLPDLPYTSGLLGFREVEAYRQVWDLYRDQHPRHVPSVCMVDGNGVLHPRRFGSACHVGVELNIPTIGVAKNLLCIEGLQRDIVQNDVRTSAEYLHEYPNANFPRGRRRCLVRQTGLLTKDGSEMLGQAMIVRSDESEERSKPIYVSVGHRVSQSDACRLVRTLSLYRVPEPVRQADIASRRRVRQIQRGEVVWQE